jgi:enediyne biosynthesis protein E2
VFAAKARAHAGFVPEHSRVGTETLTGMPVEQAVGLADETTVEPDAEGPGGSPAYELWRERIRNHFRLARTPEVDGRLRALRK